jgi:hydrogenase maturation protease
MAKLLVIGYGNTLRGDDAAGRHAAERLAQAVDREFEALSLPQLTPEVASNIAQADEVYFIDACQKGQPGRWSCQRLRPIGELPGSLAHQCDPATLLAFARALYQAEPLAWLITIPGKSFECGETLSAEVETAVGEIVAALCDRRFSPLQIP